MSGLYRGSIPRIFNCGVRGGGGVSFIEEGVRMNFEEFISSTDDPRPRKLVIYGTEGIGKTRFAANCPFGPVVFLPTEDGYQDIRPAVSKLTLPGKRLLESDTDLNQAIGLLLSSEHKFGCVVLDSAEAAEKLIQQSVARSANKETLSDIGFGKGHEKSATKFHELLQGFDALIARGLFVIVIAHAEVERFNNPTGDPYDRFTPRLDKRTSPMLREWADEVFFCNYKVYTTTIDEGFGRKTSKASGVGERVIYTTERPTHDAKNRLNLPEEIAFPMDSSIPWGIYSSAITGGNS
jgi:hypothetical protein